MQEQKVAVVTGSSSDIEFETSLMLGRNGFHTYATMHNIEKSETVMEITNTEKLSLQVVQLTEDGSVKDAINRIAGENKRIDILVHAGYGLFGSRTNVSRRDKNNLKQTSLE